MTLRVRTLAALFALLALSLTTAGGAWAAMCDRGTAVAAHGAHGGTHHGGTHHGPPAPEAPRERDAPACPLMAPGAAGSCLGAFVGAGLAARPALADAVVHDFPPPRAARGLLDAFPPFHPPEA